MRECRDELFLGGPADGQRRSVAIDSGYYSLAVIAESLPIIVSGYTFATPTEIKQHVYRRIALGGETKRFTVFVHEFMSGDEVMERLIRNYLPDGPRKKS